MPGSPSPSLKWVARGRGCIPLAPDPYCAIWTSTRPGMSTDGLCDETGMRHWQIRNGEDMAQSRQHR